MLLREPNVGLALQQNDERQTAEVWDLRARCGGQGRNRTADTGIFSLGRKFDKSILNQPLAALADFRCVISPISQRAFVRHDAVSASTLM